MKSKKITTYSNDSCYEIPENAVEFISYWNEKIMVIPEEFRASASIELEAVENHGYACLEVTVSYSRPETKEEESIRVNLESARKDQIDSRELAEFNRLKAKFEVKS